MIHSYIYSERVLIKFTCFYIKIISRILSLFGHVRLNQLGIYEKNKSIRETKKFNCINMAKGLLYVRRAYVLVPFTIQQNAFSKQHLRKKNDM